MMADCRRWGPGGGMEAGGIPTEVTPNLVQ